MLSSQSLKIYQQWPEILTRQGWRNARGSFFRINTTKTNIGSSIENAHNWHCELRWDKFESQYKFADENYLYTWYRKHIVAGLKLLKIVEDRAQDFLTTIDSNKNSKISTAARSVHAEAKRTSLLFQHMPGNCYHHGEWREEWLNTLTPYLRVKVADWSPPSPRRAYSK